MKIWGKNSNYKHFGDNVINQDLASTLNKISLCGSSAFYEGEIAKKIVDYSNKNGGYISLKDLGDFEAEIVNPISTNSVSYTHLTLPTIYSV